MRSRLLTAFPILQFGTSRFLQAHVDLFVSQALARGEAMGRIAVVQTTSSKESRKRLDAFAAGKPYRVRGQGARWRENRRREHRGDERRRRLRRRVAMGRGRAPVQRSALRRVEHRRSRLRNRSGRPAERRAAAVVPGQARQAPARAPSRRRRADHAFPMRIDAGQRQGAARRRARRARPLGRSARKRGGGSGTSASGSIRSSTASSPSRSSRSAQSQSPTRFGRSRTNPALSSPAVTPRSR